MARPQKCRSVGCAPQACYFKPRGIPLGLLEEVVLRLDEVEAIRLADLDGLYQEQAAEKMNVSRPTFGRIIASAHRKIAEALVHGKALKIGEGAFRVAAIRRFRCRDCRHAWELPSGTGRPRACPSCKRGRICRAEENQESPGRGGRRQVKGCRGNQKN